MSLCLQFFLYFGRFVWEFARRMLKRRIFRSERVILSTNLNALSYFIV